MLKCTPVQNAALEHACNGILSSLFFSLPANATAMGSIEGVIILSPSNEPILHSHFLHPLPNYPRLHADQLAVTLEAAPSSADVLPVSFTDGIPHPPASNDDGEEDSGGDAEDAYGTAQTSALVHIQHNQLRLVATFSKHSA